MRSAPFPEPPPPTPEASLALLDRAVSYARGALATVTPQLLDRATPCVDWDLGALLDHMVDSLAAITEAAGLGYVAPVTLPPSGLEVIDRLRGAACGLLDAWVPRGRCEPVLVGDQALASSWVALAGSVEISVHAWDVAQATGARTPYPVGLAEELLPYLDVLIAAEDRPVRFGPVVPGVPSEGDTADVLLARTGRSARTP